MATLTIADLDNGKRDLQTVDEVANSQADTTTTRYGQQTLTLAGALRRIGYAAPVPYAPGLSVDSQVMKVEREGVVYRPDPSVVPFTTGAWDADQWRVVQNTNDSGQAYQFPTLGAAQSAAATLPEGSAVTVEGESQGHATSGAYAPDTGVPVHTLQGYSALLAYSGKQKLIRLTTRGIAGVFEYDTGRPNTTNGGTQFAHASGTGAWARVFDGAPFAHWWGVKYDGSDAGPAMTAAIAYCNSLSPAADLKISGKVTLLTPVVIDRPIDSPLMQSYLNIVGDGAGAAFHMTNEGFMFTTPARTVAGEPMAQKVRFRDLTFSQDYWYGATYVLDDNKFISVDFWGCTFHKMRIAKTASYFQSVALLGCSSYNTRGWLLETTGGAYDIRVHMGRFQAVERIAGDTESGIFKLQGLAGSHPVNFSIWGTHFQAVNGVPIQADNVHAGDVSGCYFELNTIADMKFDTANNLANLAPNKSISLSGNFFSPAQAQREDLGWYPVRWGRTAAASSRGSTLYTDVNPGKLHAVIPETGYAFESEPGYSVGISTQYVWPKYGVVQGGEGTLTARGSINADGSVAIGSGIAAAKTATGTYYVNVAPGFTFLTDVSAVVTARNSGAQPRVAVVEGETASGFTVYTFNGSTLADCGFSFVAVGKAG